MKDVTVYTTPWCPYCHKAKRTLGAHGVPFKEINVDGDDAARRWLVEATGQRTVPQIFFGDDSIGGSSDLDALIAQGGLDARLGR